MPPPSWPSTAGKMPSGSSPDSVKASVWHTPLATMRTSTSPACGGATSISVISSGWPGPQATAARDLIIDSSPESETGGAGRPIHETLAVSAVTREGELRLLHATHGPTLGDGLATGVEA